MTSGGVYAELFTLQASAYLDEAPPLLPREDGGGDFVMISD